MSPIVPHNKFYFYGGFNYAFPSVKAYEIADHEIADFTPSAGVGFQVGGAFWSSSKVALGVEYKLARFYSTQVEIELLTGNPLSTVATYSVSEFALFLSFRLF